MRRKFAYLMEVLFWEKLNGEIEQRTDLIGHESSIWVFNNGGEGTIVIKKHHNLLPLRSTCYLLEHAQS